MTFVRRILLVAVFVLLLVGGWRFAHENEAVVSIHYVLGRTVDVALWQALLAAVTAGVLGTGLVLGLSLMRARMESRRFRKALVKLESEVHQLRNLPVVASDEEVEAGLAPAIEAGEAASSG